MNGAPTTNHSAGQLFTAGELAAALGRNRSTVAHALAGVPAAGVKIVAGNEARAWKVADLPAGVAEAVNALARRLGARNAETALRQCAAPWSPEIPVAECHPASLEQARKLRDAQRPALNRQNAPGLSRAEFESLGCEDYRRVFGYTITPRHWRDLFARTLRRAGAVPDFERLEIYLPDRLKRKGAVAPLPAHANEVEQRLSAFMDGFAESGNPTARERESLWTEAMETMQSLVDAGESFQRAGRRVRAALRQVAPFLAASPEALQKAFARKVAAWQASGGAAQSMADGRRQNTGNHDAYELPPADVDTLTHLAVWRFHGSLAAAWREAHERKLLSPETCARYPLSPIKSHVPHKVRDCIGPEVEIFMLMKRGRRVVDELTPHVSRTFEGLHSCQIFQGDDFTMPVYFYVPDGRGWFDLLRGQVLLFIDFRSSKIVGWTLIPEPQYSSLSIWTQLKRLFAEHGIPEMLYFERGIWQRSKLLTGRHGDAHAAEMVQGLRELGIRFKHAIRPRSKTVERVGGLLQDLMEGEPGYCGRDERRDLPAHTKEILTSVRARRVQPATCLYSFEQWNARLGELIATYNAAVQQGVQLGGRSPDQAFDEFMNPEKERRHSDLELSFLLTHKEEREVKPGQSIKFTVGKTTFRYYGPELAPFMGRRVIAAFDPEQPEHLIVTDMKRRHLELVPLAKHVSAAADLLGAEAQANLAHELSRAAGQMAHLRARYNVVKSKLPMRRPGVESLNNLVAGARVQRLRQKADERRQTAERTTRAARKIGMHIPERVRIRETTQEDIGAVERFLTLPSDEEVTPS